MGTGFLKTLSSNTQIRYFSSQISSFSGLHETFLTDLRVLISNMTIAFKIARGFSILHKTLRFEKFEVASKLFFQIAS